MDVLLQLYAQKGSRLNKLKALEVTPDWNYIAQADEAQLSASHTSDAQLEFSQVSSTQFLE